MTETGVIPGATRACPDANVVIWIGIVVNSTTARLQVEVTGCLDDIAEANVVDSAEPVIALRSCRIRLTREATARAHPFRDRAQRLQTVSPVTLPREPEVRKAMNDLDRLAHWVGREEPRRGELWQAVAELNSTIEQGCDPRRPLLRCAVAVHGLWSTALKRLLNARVRELDAILGSEAHHVA